MMLGAVGALAVLVLILSQVLGSAAAKPKSSGATVFTGTVDGIQCNPNEQLTYHRHAKLDIYVNGKQFQVPPFIGIPDVTGSKSCLYYLHTHQIYSAQSGSGYPQGVIHMEYPSTPKVAPTLKQLFDIWQKTRPDAAAPLPAILKGGSNVRIFVNQKPYKGSATSVKLRPDETIVIEVGRPYVKRPAPFNFVAWHL